jgi:hypothetical protein
MNLIRKAALALSITVLSPVAPAAQTVPAMQLESRATMYTASGILRSQADPTIIKLVQGLAYGPTMDDAIRAFKQDVHAKYPRLFVDRHRRYCSAYAKAGVR